MFKYETRRLSFQFNPPRSLFSIKSSFQNWYEISNKVRSTGFCKMCGLQTNTLEAQELWQYDDNTHEQTLKDIIPMCKDCRSSMRMVFINDDREQSNAFSHYKSVNQLSFEEAKQDFDDAFNVWKVRSNFVWMHDAKKIKEKVSEITNLSCDLDEPIDGKYYTYVPYNERENAKLLGAKWDADRKLWYFMNETIRAKWNSRENSYSKDNFAVLDTETNWSDRVMSIGIVIANCQTMQIVKSLYCVIQPEYKVGGMFSNTLFPKNYETPVLDRSQAINMIKNQFNKYNVKDILAYNASFDKRHLLELYQYNWYDIMMIAAYKQYNDKLPDNAEYHGSGRLKKGYGVEPIYRLLSNDNTYNEKHNALTDAADELKIMQLLNLPIDIYFDCAQI